MFASAGSDTSNKFCFFFLLLLLKIYDLLSVKNWDNVVLLSSPPS